jgi:predicted HAD superfamily hydrolase
MPRVHSFDVFDTCLLRTCAFPSDIFIEVARALVGSKPSPDECGFADDFRSARTKAEVTARSQTDREDITLQEIWAELASKFPPYDATAGIEVELDIERRNIGPNRNVLSVVKASRESGARIAFISDMYLPAAFIQEQLECHGFFREGDGLFVSSEVGLTKRTGNLFRHMLRVEGVDPAHVRHYGDNPVSDVEMPRSLGIDARHYTETALDHCERGLVNASLNQRHTAANLAGRCRLFRLSGDTPGDEYRSLVAEFLGPFLLAFASWVLARARRDGVRRLYFLSRDCYLLSYVAQVLAPKFGIEVRYLSVSRQAILLPAIREISENGIPWLERYYEKATIERLVAKLDLTDSIAASLLCKALAVTDKQHIIAGNAEWEIVWKVLTTSPVREVLEARIEERREHALRYFKEQGLDDSASWALVDIGWHLVCQSSLRSLLNRIPVRGYYLGLHSDRVSPADAGCASALFYYGAPERWPSDRARIFVKGALLEHLLGIAPHGTVHHYESSPSGAVPVRSAVTGPALEAINKLERLVEEFAMANADLTDELGVASFARDVLDKLTHIFFSQPKREWIESLRFIEIAADQNNLDAAPLAVPVTWHHFLIGCLPLGLQRRFALPDRNIWPEASLCISSKAVRKAIAMKAAAGELQRCFRALFR